MLYCISGIWTDEWWDNPAAWAGWACAFHGWSGSEWQQFARLWAAAGRGEPAVADRTRRALMATYRLYLFDWRRVPGGSTHGDVCLAARHLHADLQGLQDVVLVGHSKGGAVIKQLLTAGWSWNAGTRPKGAIFMDAPLDLLRETVGWMLQWGVRPQPGWRAPADVPCVTINNWLDLSGGRLRGAENLQVCIWNDYLIPYPPHGLKSRQAAAALAMLAARSQAPLPGSSVRPPSSLPTTQADSVPSPGRQHGAGREGALPNTPLSR